MVIIIIGTKQIYVYAYQILRRGGFEDEDIIVFMYDDIAKILNNSRSDIIINHSNDYDVYHGVPS